MMPAIDRVQTPAPIVRGAGISPCGRYRYWLTRTWDLSRPAACWIMLNPSTADAARDDPTIRRCVRFSRRWGFGGLVAVNLFAWRATSPTDLIQATDPVGPGNDASLLEQAEGRRIFVAWGNHGGLLGRADAVLQLLDASWRAECLGVTSTGQPRHPLYVAGDVVPITFRTREGNHG